MAITSRASSEATSVRQTETSMLSKDCDFYKVREYPGVNAASHRDLNTTGETFMQWYAMAGMGDVVTPYKFPRL